VAADLSDFGLLGEQSFPKWDIPCPGQINSLFKRAFKYGYVKSVIKLEELLQDYDDKLFTEATQGNHAMHHLLPSPKSTCYNL